MKQKSRPKYTIIPQDELIKDTVRFERQRIAPKLKRMHGRIGLLRREVTNLREELGRREWELEWLRREVTNLRQEQERREWELSWLRAKTATLSEFIKHLFGPDRPNRDN